MTKICIDASVFIGLHNTNDELRISCKNFFVENLNHELLISFEQIGEIDNTIWELPFKEQLIYFDFMDYFMTISNTVRKAYNREIFSIIFNLDKGNKHKSKIEFSKLLTLSFAIYHNAKLFTLHDYPQKLIRDVKLLKKPNAKKELKFASELERKYQNSLQIIV